MLCSQSFKRHNAAYNGAIEYDSEGMAYGCSAAEYAANPADCEAGGWGFILVGIVGIFYSIALFHTAVFGFLTWLKRLEAPPTTHGLGPKKPDAVVAVRTVSCQLSYKARQTLDWHCVAVRAGSNAGQRACGPSGARAAPAARTCDHSTVIDDGPLQRQGSQFVRLARDHVRCTRCHCGNLFQVNWMQDAVHRAGLILPVQNKCHVCVVTIVACRGRTARQ